MDQRAFKPILSVHRTPAEEFPAGGGAMGDLIRAFDWSKTSLGPRGTWPLSLRTAVNIVLASPVPIVMLWGPEGIMIYNDAYSGFAGATMRCSSGMPNASVLPVPVRAWPMMS